MTGLASLVSSAKGPATGAGGISSGHIVPASYAVTAANSQMTRTMRMRLVGSAVTGVDISPPFEDKPDRVPLSAQDKRGVMDPVSAFVFTVPGSEPLVGPPPATATFRSSTAIRVSTCASAMSASGRCRRRATSGPVAVCAVRYVPIAGHRPDRPATKFMAENKEHGAVAGADRDRRGCCALPCLRPHDDRHDGDRSVRIQRRGQVRLQLNSSGRNGIGITPTPSSIKRLRFVGRRLAADRARRRIAFVDRARFLGKFRADVVGIGYDLLAQPAAPSRAALLTFVE